jgi:predicted CXXCH cytochrome family protein
MVRCTATFYAAAASVAGLEFHDIDYKSRIAGIGPLMPDQTMAPESGEAGVTCVACHAPHDAVRGKSAGLRTESAGALCQTCHEEKWQNTILEATAGEVGNGFEYPGEDYDVFNPHRTDGKCVACHLGDANRTLDVRHVRAVGGHTLRMRDAGGNGVLGGFGPRPNDASDKNPDETDDVLHLEACRDCHGDVESFDVNGRQSEIHARWQDLGRLLEAANAGVLPGVRPGDKCATCHRGGTQPFDDDPGLVLENAYTNYKLVMNDRSWGVHNPGYVSKLLGDSIAAVEQYLATHGL